MIMKNLGVRTVELQSLKEKEDLKRLIPQTPQQLEQIETSIRENGIAVPIVVDKEMNIIDGYTRFEIAKKLGIKEVPVIIMDFSSPAEERIWAMRMNVERRQLTPEKFLELIDKIVEESKKMNLSVEEMEKQVEEVSSASKVATGSRIYYVKLRAEAPELADIVKKANVNAKQVYDFYEAIKSHYGDLLQLGEEKITRILTNEELRKKVMAEPSILVAMRTNDLEASLYNEESTDEGNGDDYIVGSIRTTEEVELPKTDINGGEKSGEEAQEKQETTQKPEVDLTDVKQSAEELRSHVEAQKDDELERISREILTITIKPVKLPKGKFDIIRDVDADYLVYKTD